MAIDEKKLTLHFQRFEFKYQIPLVVIEGLIPELLKYMNFDSYALDLPDNYYHVFSLYYDSLGKGCYYEKIAGLEKRKKLRVRYYETALNPQTPVFLEIKGKHGAVILKDRVKLNYAEAENLLLDNQMVGLNLSEDNKNTLDHFLWIKLTNGMLPKVLVKYKRKPFIGKLNPDFRVTIDFDIRAQDAIWINENQEGKEVWPGMAILELKFNNSLPEWFQWIIRRYNLEQKPFSKYCSSLEIVSPEFITSYADYFHRNLFI